MESQGLRPSRLPARNVRTVSRPFHGSRQAAERGFTIIEVTIALLITAEVILAGLALFDFHNKLARVQTQISDMQQSLRVAQYDMVRLTRMAGRGGVPAILQPTSAAPIWGAVAVRNNVGIAGVSDQLAIGFSGTPLAVDSSDILTVRGAFSTPIFQVNSTDARSLTLTTFSGSVHGPTTALTGTVVVCAYTATGVPQNISALISLLSANQPDALLMVSPLDDSIVAVVELNPATSVVTGTQASCSTPSWVATAPSPNGIVLGFTITGDTLSNQFHALYTTSVLGLPSQMTTVASVAVLEEYRYYVRQDYVIPGNTASDPAPHLSRARMYPGTETPYQGNATNLQNDIADNVLDLQVALGVDLLPIGAPDGVITEDNPPDKADEWLGNAVGDTLTPQSPLREVRISTLVKTANRDPTYQAPLIVNIEDHVYTAASFANTTAGRSYRNRLLQTVIGMRNL
jgi:hypothetical protein